METKYAGFWWRFLAYLIDYAILFIFAMIALIPFWSVLGYSSFIFMHTEPSEIEAIKLGSSIVGAYLLAILLVIAGGWLYYALMESSKHQATLGKMALGLIVTDTDGNRLSFARATGRYFGRFLSSLTFFIGYIIAGFTSKKQALHDLIANTLVMRTEKAVAQGKKYAGFWRRFVAYLIDYILLLIFEIVALIPFFFALSYAIVQLENSDPTVFETAKIAGSVIGTYILAVLLTIAAGWLYFALMESSKHQATFGKMAIGLIVTDIDGNRLTFGRATGRYFGKILSATIFLVGYIIAGLTEKKQALHDMLANTLVWKRG